MFTITKRVKYFFLLLGFLLIAQKVFLAEYLHLSPNLTDFLWGLGTGLVLVMAISLVKTRPAAKS